MAFNIVQPFCGELNSSIALGHKQFCFNQPAYYICEALTNAMTSHIGLIAKISLKTIACKKLLLHEMTVENKVRSYIDSFHRYGCQFNPLLLVCRDKALSSLLKSIIVNAVPSVFYSQSIKDKYRIWPIQNNETIKKLENHYDQVHKLYLADGHHRIAALEHIYFQSKCLEQEKNFIAYILPDSEITLQGFHKALKTLGSCTEKKFMQKLEEIFDINKLLSSREIPKNTEAMYFNGSWYSLLFKPSYNKDNRYWLIQELFQTIFDDNAAQQNVTSIEGSISFEALEKLSSSQQYKAIFYISPLTFDLFYTLSDSERKLPPNTTFFLPKLPSDLISFFLNIKSNSFAPDILQCEF